MKVLRSCFVPWMILAAAGGGACSSTESPDRNSGQTGSPGESECQEDAECAEVANTTIAARQSGDPGFEATYRGGTCEGVGVCRITYVTDAGCSPNVYGPFYDCSLDDATIRERYLDDLTPGEGECVEDPETGTGTCAEPGDEPVYHPRDPGEWQGMLVDLSITPPCDESAWCGLARACVEGVCTACEADAECAAGEGCVLDHCVRLELIECRKAADCAGSALCALSGYTGGTARGNEDLRAYCLGSSGDNGAR